ncbi:hypothetical protein LA080_012239 [Diaporthe eres]|nr:hypothetical protein LA080_012239 [Diaporthe eres]
MLAVRVGLDDVRAVVASGADGDASRSLELGELEETAHAEKYRGMQSVVLHGPEAYADITLSTAVAGGTWKVPPFFIDSVCHLAGFAMTVSDAVVDTRADFCVTPGWG